MCIRVYNEETQKIETIEKNCKECVINSKGACPYALTPFGKDYEELKLFD